jgi:DNA replication and repair protein RecF
VEGPGERRRFLDRMTLSLLPDHAETATRYDRAMRERNRLLKDGGDDGRWLSALEAQMAEHGVALAKGRAHVLEALLAAQGAAPDSAGAFPRAEAVIIGEFDAEMTTEGFARVLAEGRGRDAQAGRTLIGPHRSDLAVRYAEKDAPASECSTGEQKALLVSLLLANARALHAETGTAPILLLDEIAAHFDADRRAALFTEIEALGAQAWMTGTEPGLFDAMGSSAQRIEVSECDAGSTIVQ